VVRVAGTDYPQITQSPLTTYSVLSVLVEKNPNTSALWTAGQLDAAEFGEEIVT
jgi:hypothetical protein